jgi:guanylate kinase
MNKNILITLTGKSGSGKSTIEKMLVNNCGLKQAVSHTSRPIRINEQEGENYYYVTKDVMLEMYDKGELAEFIEYNGNLYGVSVNELINSQVIVIEPSGLKQVKEKMKDKKKVVSFFLDVSEDTMRKRMNKRGDSEDNINARIEHDRHHFNVEMKDFDYVIKVDNFAPSQILDIINTIIDTNILHTLDLKGDNKNE